MVRLNLSVNLGCSAGKAAEDGRTPRRCRELLSAPPFRKVLECGCPLPLSLCCKLPDSFNHYLFPADAMEKASAIRFFISSGETSSMCVGNIQWCPKGSVSDPVTPKLIADRFLDRSSRLYSAGR
jgi:hypothetical protein